MAMENEMNLSEGARRREGMSRTRPIRMPPGLAHVMRALALLLLLAVTLPAVAQNLDAKIDAATQRWQNYQERLQSTDPVIRSETLAVALRDENSAIRNGALWYVLRSRDDLPISLVVSAGSSLDPGSIPVLEVEGVEWNGDRHTFHGRSNSQRQLAAVRGELIDGKLRVNYLPLGMASNFPTSEDAGSGHAGVQRRRCTVVLEFEPSRNALEGPLQCEGMSQTFTARLPLG